MACLQYIKTLTTLRCRGRKEDIVPAIDDVRNGLLLTSTFHKLLRRYIAFMPVRPALLSYPSPLLVLVLILSCLVRRVLPATQLRHGLQRRRPRRLPL